MFQHLCALLLSEGTRVVQLSGSGLAKNCQKGCNYAKKRNFKVRRILGVCIQLLIPFPKSLGIVLHRDWSWHQVGHPLSIPGKSLFSKVKSCCDSQKHVRCKTRVGLSWGFLVGNQSFGILQVAVAVHQFRRSLAMDLYTVDLSLLETLTV